MDTDCEGGADLIGADWVRRVDSDSESIRGTSCAWRRVRVVVATRAARRVVTVLSLGGPATATPARSIGPNRTAVSTTTWLSSRVYRSTSTSSSACRGCTSYQGPTSTRCARRLTTTSRHSWRSARKEDPKHAKAPCFAGQLGQGALAPVSRPREEVALSGYPPRAGAARMRPGRVVPQPTLSCVHDRVGDPRFVTFVTSCHVEDPAAELVGRRVRGYEVSRTPLLISVMSRGRR